MRRIEVGARMLHVDLKPHQHELGEILDAGEEVTPIQWPRRSGKTTGVWCWLLGRCETEDDTLILTTAQQGLKARERFLSVQRTLDRYGTGPVIRKGAGQESMEWDNGARLWVTAPKPESVRGDAADVVYVDEPQELAPTESLDLQQGVLPLMDTRPGAQVVLSGTPGKVRAGWYWQELQAAIEGAPKHALSLHAATLDMDLTDPATWPLFHPGLVHGMTTVEVLEARLASMGLAAFSMEYGGIWPGSSGDRAIPEEWWTRAERGSWPERPQRVGLAFDTEPDGSAATLMAAWRDEDGVAYIEVVAHGTPREIGTEAVEVSRRRRIPIGGDTIGANAYVWDGIERAKPKPKTMPLKLADMVTAATGLYSELKEGTLRHSGQPVLDAAAESAAWRDTGDSGRLFGRRASKGPASPMVAGSAALVVFDRMPAPASTKIHTRRAS